MGARVSVVVWIQNEDGPHEVHEEGHESAEDRAQRERGVSIGCGFFRREAQGREGNRGGVHGALRQRAEENGCVQDWSEPEAEAEGQARDACSQGCESIHERTLRFQGEAGFENREGAGAEETEGGRELISSHGGGLSCWRAGWAAEPWRADSPRFRL